MKSLGKMFDPESIAVIGASNTKGHVGYSLMKNLVEGCFSGIVYPVNQKGKSVFGIECHRSVLEISGKVDLAIIATPAETVAGLVKECVQAKVGSVIVVSSGFGEAGDEGKKREKELAAAIRGTGIRLLGPNCLGYIRTDKGINASFAIRNALPGKMALISQSGALCSGILDWALKQKVGFKYFISIGSMLDIDFADLIDFLQLDPEIESIAIYMESVRDARGFMSAAKAFSESKPIIVAKSGRFAESAKAAVSHTGSMAGNDAVFEAVFERAGIVRVEDIQDLLGCSEALAKQPLPKDNRVLIVTNAGGPGVMATDAIITRGCRLAQLSKESMDALERHMPANWSKGNPVDLLGDAGPERYEKALDIAFGEKNADCIIVILSPQAVSRPAEVARAVAEKARGCGKTVLACWIGESFVEAGREILRKKGVPCYRTPEEAVRVFSYMDSYRRNIRNLYETPEEIEFRKKPDRAMVGKMIADYLRRGQLIVSEVDSKKMIEEYGLPVNKTFLAASAKQAVAMAEEIGYPVALKIASDDITHKSDVNGVALNLASEKEVRAAFNRIVASAKKARPDARIGGASVQKMVGMGNVELILGKKNDPIFGPVLVFGAGGITAEIFGDRAIGLPPLTQTLAKRMVMDTKIHGLFFGPKARVKADLRGLERILVEFSQFVVDFPEIEEIDINPLVVSKQGFFAVDARVVLSRCGQDNSCPVPAIRPYPAELEKKVRIGKESFVFRAIRPEDEPLMEKLFKSFSKETGRKRFFHPIKKMTHEMLVRYCFNDYDREITIVVEKPGKNRRLLGVGRFIKDAGGESAEFAIAVTDVFQKKGFGRALFEYAEGVARARGLKRIWGLVSGENMAMIAMAKSMGFEAKPEKEERACRLEKKL